MFYDVFVVYCFFVPGDFCACSKFPVTRKRLGNTVLVHEKVPVIDRPLHCFELSSILTLYVVCLLYLVAAGLFSARP